MAHQDNVVASVFFFLGMCISLIVALINTNLDPYTCEVTKQIVKTSTPVHDPWKGEEVKIKIWIVAQEWADSPVKQLTIRPDRKFIPLVRIDENTTLPATTEAEAAIDFFKVGSTHDCWIGGWTTFYRLSAFRRPYNSLGEPCLMIFLVIMWTFFGGIFFSFTGLGFSIVLCGVGEQSETNQSNKT
jgi:hypothetical protein